MKTLLSAVVASTLALSAIEADAQTAAREQRVSLSIKSTTLAEALDQWAVQGGYQIVAPKENWDIAKKLSVPGLNGTFTAQAALEKLLEGTPLTSSWLTERAVSIREKSAPSRPASLQTIGGPAQQSLPDSKFIADGLSGQEAGARNERHPATSSSDGRSAVLGEGRVDPVEEIVVTGTHIRGLENGTVPVIVLDRKYIESTGIATTSALIESLPQNFALASPAGVLVPGVSAPNEQGSSINLRGIGEGTTLVLLNGRRMASGFIGSAVDISALPLSVIERVEVLTDGASAIYGSDAIGGVVNFILRSDFEGAETQVRGGWADGVDEYRLAQGLGTTWGSGNALASFEYYQRDLLRASERDFVPSTSGVGSLYPDDQNYSAMVHGQQELSSTVSVFADALYTRRDSYNEGGQVVLDQTFSTENPQLTATLGLDWALGADWQVEVSGSYARNKLDQVQSSNDASDFIVDTLFDIEAAEIKADGGLFQSPGGDVRAAVGVNWRSEQLDATSGRVGVPGGITSMTWGQTVRSAFGELHVPIAGPDNGMAGLRRLELSLAGRYDDYSNFGSSLDPQIGLMWEPVRDLRLRTSWGTSYKAPKLTDYDLRFNSAIAIFFTDPQAPGGTSHQLWISGADATNYSAQESESMSFGVEFTPGGARGLQMGLNYYKIKYRNRIADPQSPDVVLNNPAGFGELIIRDPAVAQVNDYIAIGDLGQGLFTLDPDFNSPDPSFTPDSIDVIIDGRRRNLSTLETSGLDALIKYGFDAGTSNFEIGLASTYIFEIDQRATNASELLDTVDTFFNPSQFRVRGNLGWHHGGWSTTMFVNHTAPYTDNRAADPLPVSSYTTVDAHLAYEFAEGSSGLWSGVTVALSAQNLLDEDPPETAVIVELRDMGFDPTNSNPMGRLISLQIAKTW